MAWLELAFSMTSILLMQAMTGHVNERRLGEKIYNKISFIKHKQGFEDDGDKPGI